MAKPLYNYDFLLKLTGTGETPEEAYDVAVNMFINATAEGKTPEADSFTKYNEPIVDTMHLECAICGQEEEVRTDDFGDWMPDIYLGETHIGAGCPDCQIRYCEQGDEGESEVLLHKVDFQSGQCRSLQNVIMNLLNHRREDIVSK